MVSFLSSRINLVRVVSLSLLFNVVTELFTHTVPEGIPPLTHEQHVALDGLHFTSEDRALDIDLLPGDFEFFSNLKIFHARTWSEDDATHT